ncbi:peptidase M14 [Weeksellaceae bacterium TAE3-ERU29]|nr:peptidase M14 [Weeksellaceae bacterium TAE3-ERU29]
MKFTDILSNYNQWREHGLKNRYISTKTVENKIKEKVYNYKVIGKSFLEKPIYKLTLGNGKHKVLLWSQMHGNESTATRSMFDIFNLLTSSDYKAFYDLLLNQITIEYIPQLNPDGADLYTRRNAMDIDINRDFIQETSSEIKTLKNEVNSKVYKCLFNLHDQRTIFNIQNTKNPSTLSLLAPVPNKEKELTESRKYSIKIVSYIYRNLQMYTNNIAKFSDEFYPLATGDNFQKHGTPILLFECGHSEDDYLRENTRKITALGILSALFKVAELDDKKINSENCLDIYNSIPNNDNKALDIIYKDVCVSNGTENFYTDIGVLYSEELNTKENKIDFIPRIQEIGDLSNYFGYDIRHVENRVFKNNSNNVPKIGEIITMDNFVEK